MTAAIVLGILAAALGFLLFCCACTESEARKTLIKRAHELAQSKETNAEAISLYAEANERAIAELEEANEKAIEKFVEADIDNKKEITYLQSLLAEVDVDRNRALEMASAIQKWRKEHWENSVVCRALMEIPDGSVKENLREALVESYNKQTEEFIQITGPITGWRGHVADPTRPPLPILREPAPGNPSFKDGIERSQQPAAGDLNPDADASDRDCRKGP
jgi:hypothetical protein